MYITRHAIKQYRKRVLDDITTLTDDEIKERIRTIVRHGTVVHHKGGSAIHRYRGVDVVVIMSPYGQRAVTCLGPVGMRRGLSKLARYEKDLRRVLDKRQGRWLGR